MRRSTAVTLAVSAVLLGSAVAFGVPLWWSARGADERTPAINPGAAVRLAERPARPSTARVPGTPAAPAGTSTRRTGSTNASAGSPHRPAPSRPVAVRIAALGLAAPVVPVGVARDGSVAIPESVRTVGWYRWGARPASAAGSTVLVGHVDSATQGAGAFFALRTVRADARIVVVTADHQVHRYRVVSRQAFPKSTVPLRELFSLGGTARLTLITCGGPFDRSARSYLDNVVVTAVAV